MLKIMNLIRLSAVSVLVFAAMCSIITGPCFSQPQNARARMAAMTPDEFKSRLKGPIFSFPTPFAENFEIDYVGVGKLIERALAYDCGIVALTSGNSRYDRLSFEEIKELTRFIVNITSGRALSIASTGEWERDAVYEYVRFAEAVGASAVQVQLPKDLTGSDNIADITDFYRQVASHTQLGIILHGGYSVELLTELVKNQSIVAMKEDVDYPYYVNRQILFGDRLAIFGGGNDARYLHGYPYGSPAYYSSLYTYAPQAGRDFWRAMQQNDLRTATEIVLKYDLPFISKFSLPMWYAAIAYSGGPERFIRPKNETLPEKNMKEVRELFSGMDLTPATNVNIAVTNGLSMPMPRGGHVAGMVDGRLVVAGGNNWSIDKKTKYWYQDAVVFDNDKWVTGPGLPKPVAYAAHANAGNGLYVAGGTSDGTTALTDVFQLTSLSDGQWKTLPKLPKGIMYSSGTISDGMFYVACGSDGKTNFNTMYVLDINDPNGKWKSCKPLPGPGRILPALVTAGNYVYLLGGLSDGVPLSDLYRYNPKKDEWVKLDNLPMKGYAWSVQPVGDNQLLVTARADDSKPFAIHKDIWLVSLNDISMSKVGELEGPTTTATLTPVKNGSVWWLIGGEPDSKLNRSSRVSVITLEDKGSK